MKTLPSSGVKSEDHVDYIANEGEEEILAAHAAYRKAYAHIEAARKLIPKMTIDDAIEAGHTANGILDGVTDRIRDEDPDNFSERDARGWLA